LLNAADQEVPGVSFVGGVTVEVTAAGGGPPGQRIGFAPDALDFGQVALGMSSRRVLRISNFGFSELQVVDLQASGNEFRLFSAAPFVVSPFGFVELTVEFAPETAGDLSADLLIQSNDPQQPEVHVPLVGRATP
jgi:hypothetical protein